MIKVVIRLGAFGALFCQRLARTFAFFIEALYSWPKPKKIWPLLSKQLYNVGILSLLIVLVSGLFIGMVICLQGYHTLKDFGASSQLGRMVALSVLRELGPVVTALLFAGRAGSALTAEIGLMRSTEQLSSMEMLGVNPMQTVIFPRLWAGIIALPILTILFNVAAIYGGAMVSSKLLHLDMGVFWANMQDIVRFDKDVVNGIIKSLCFGCVITWVAVYQGFFSEPNASGISKATTKTVVFSSLLVLGLDFILTAVMMGG